MIIHFWELPENRNYIIFNKEFKQKVLKSLDEKKYAWKIRNKVKNGKISIQKIKIISKKENIPLEIIEKNILWIGGNNSKGISNPKFPINFVTREGSRFIAAIMNDGTLTKNNKNSYGRLMYDNFDESLRNSVLRDCLDTFGGKSEEISFRNNEKKKYFEFSSVIRDMMELVLKSKGPKCESNLNIPEFILKNKELMKGWIEQTVADEGEVKNYPTIKYKDKYRRSVVWRRSLDVSDLFNKKIEKDIPLRKLNDETQKNLQNRRCNLISEEEKMLLTLGITYKLYNLGIYPTVKNKVRTRWQITITKRENLIKLRELIKIPSKIKDEKLTTITKGFVRYKEPLKVLEAIRILSREKDGFSSIDLKNILNYKTTNPANKWLNQFEKKGFVRKIKESSYGAGAYRKPAEYIIILDK